MGHFKHCLRYIYSCLEIDSGPKMDFTRLVVLLFVICIATQSEGRKKPNNNNNDDTTDDGTDDGTDDDTGDDTDDGSDDDSSEDSSYAATVKALIDAGTCSSVSTKSNCGDDAAGYYETFEYNGKRVVIVSGAPDHEAESELFIPQSEGGRFNPNVRCERWQYSVVPLNPTKSTSTDWSSYEKYPYYGMGAYGY